MATATSDEGEIAIDSLIFALESDFLHDDDAFLNDIDFLIAEVGSEAVESEFCCPSCPKKCKSKRGLTRHMNTKHSTK